MEMRKALVGLLVVLVATMAMAQDVPFSDKDLESEESMWSLYERWRSVYTSSLDLADKDRKFKVFKMNARYINDFNKKEGMTYKLGLNKFADMTLEEFTAMYTGAKVDASDAFASVSEPEEWEEQLVGSTPTTWDWRQHGVVTSVKDQSPCESCWAFSAVGAVEGIHAIATGQLLTLSEQQVLDCSGAGTCKGGWPNRVLQNFTTSQGITLARNYPAYSAQQQACRTPPNSPVVKVGGAYRLPRFNEAALMERVSKQPVVVIIEANKSFQLYKEGVYTGPCGTSLNHAVLAVGYGVTRNNINYWIIKNSWGTNWGESGYIRMKRGVSREGLCGITLRSVSPIMNGAYPTKKSSKHCPSSTDDAAVVSI